MKLNIPTYPIGWFQYNKTKNQLSIEASVLAPVDRSFFSPIYSDACDLGFDVEGKNHVITFGMYESDEGSWSFKPIMIDGVSCSWRLHPSNLWSMSLVVFND